MDVDEKIYQSYWSKGWVVVEDVYQPHEVERIAKIALAVSKEELKEGDSSYVVDHSTDGARAPRKIDEAFFKHPTFQEFVLDERLLRILEALLGNRPLLLNDQILMKPPKFGSAKPHHQDNFYFRCFPADQVITAWTALDDADASNGCLRYIDESHKGPILPHIEVPGEPYNLTPSPDLIDLSKESLAVVHKGGVVFHHSQTLHMSPRNESDRWRRAYTSHWVTESVTRGAEIFDSPYFRRYPASMQLHG